MIRESRFQICVKCCDKTEEIKRTRGKNCSTECEQNDLKKRYKHDGDYIERTNNTDILFNKEDTRSNLCKYLCNLCSKMTLFQDTLLDYTDALPTSSDAIAANKEECIAN